jgi:hypothetical protein
MRDIREDLQERLDAIGRDREDLKRRIADLETIELAIQAIFKRECENFAAPLSTRTERSFESFGAKDDAVVGGVKASHWGEFKVG